MTPPPTSNSTTTLRTERFQCVVAATWAERIERLLATDPQEWSDWEEVKSSTVRTVYRGELGDPDGQPVRVHLKLFRAVRLSDRARDAISGSRSGREFHNLATARERNLPCVEPLAAGTYTGSFGSRSFLLTRTIDGATLPRTAHGAEDARAAGTLLRTAHDAGLHARDLHPGNVLRQPDGTLALLDLTSAVFADPVDSRGRGRALAFFCLDLDAGILDPAARPLLDAYAPDPTTLDTAGKAARRLRNRALSAFGRRAFRRCRTTTLERLRRKPRVYLHTPTAHLWDAAREAFANLADIEPVKSGRRGAVYLTEDLAIKVRSAADGRRLFESAYWLQFAGVNAPAPVALSTFQSRGITAAVKLPHPDLATEMATLPPDTRSLTTSATLLGHSVGRLHSFGLRNRDLKFENLVRDPATGLVFMVDLDGVKRCHPTDGRGRAGDLGRLLAAFRQAGSVGGDAIVRAFLRSYVRTCRQLLYPVPHRKHVLAQAEQRARAKLAGQVT